MNSTEIIFAAGDLGIRLSVTKDDGILCKLASRLTCALRAEIKDNREALVRDVLMADALRYLADRYVDGTDLEALDDLEDRLEEACAAGDLKAYREAIRAFVRAGLLEIERDSKKKSFASDQGTAA